MKQPNRFVIQLLSLCLLLLVAIFTFWALDYAKTLSQLRMLTFQTRDLERARELLAGKWIFFGPETTGGGHLPGPFYYLLLSLALCIRNSWISAFDLLFVMNAVAGVAGWLYFKRISRAAALVWLAVFLLSEALDKNTNLFLNVSYLGPMIIFTMICFSIAYQEGANGRKTAFLLGMFLVGLDVQLHYSAAALLAAVAITQIAARWSPRRAAFKFSNGTLFLAVLVFAAPLSPYLLWSAFGTSGTSDYPVPLNGNIGRAIESVFNFVRIQSSLQFAEGLKTFAHFLPFVFIMALIALFLDRFHRREHEAHTGSGPEFFLWVSFWCALPSAAYVLFAPIGYRYGLPLSVSAIFLTPYLLERLKTKDRQNIFLLVGTILLLAIILWRLDWAREWEGFSEYLTARNWIIAAILLTAAAVSLRLTHRRSLPAVLATIILAFAQNPSALDHLPQRSGSLPSKEVWDIAFTEICNTTGWAPDEIAQRLYYVNGHMELDPWPFIKDSWSHCTKINSSEIPSGYILSSHFNTREAYQEWLLDQNIAPEVKAGLQDKSIRLGEVRRIESIDLVPYFVGNPEHYPPYFHNIGRGYRPSRGIWPASFPFPGVQALASGKYLIGWNECPNRHPYCNVGAVVSVQRERNETTIDLEVVGDSMGQSSPWIVPGWTESWQNPYLDVSCGTSKTRVEVAKVIGYDRTYGFKCYGYDYFLSNHALLTPLRRTFHFPCAVTEITLGRKSSKVETLNGVEEIPAQPLTLKL